MKLKIGIDIDTPVVDNVGAELSQGDKTDYLRMREVARELERHARALAANLDEVLRDRLTQANLHQLPPAMRRRIEQARTTSVAWRTFCEERLK